MSVIVVDDRADIKLFLNLNLWFNGCYFHIHESNDTIFEAVYVCHGHEFVNTVVF